MKDIEGYEGRYAVAEDGKVWSKITNRWIGGKPCKNGYVYVHLWKDGKGKLALVHRLVGLAYIPNPEGKHTINHKDGNKQNNCVSNLEWATASEQQLHAVRIGLIESVGVRQPQRRLSDADIEAILSLKGKGRQVDIATKFGVSQAYVSTLFRGTRRKLLTAGSSVP